jgi:hypothetical protein
VNLVFRCRIDCDLPTDTIRLQMVRPQVDGRVDVLMEDGSWQRVDPGVAPVGAHGFPLPADALPALAEAVQAHLGNALPSHAEVAVLREWLAKEQARVDEKWSAS